jgi:hypothetical protein
MDLLTAFIANLPATILAFASLLGVILNYLKTNKVAADVKTIEIATNSMKDALVTASRAEGLAAGKLEQSKLAPPRNPHLGGG